MIGSTPYPKDGRSLTWTNVGCASGRVRRRGRSSRSSACSAGWASGRDGSFLGMAAAIVATTGAKAGLTTIRGLAWLAAIAAIVLFFLVSIP